MATQKLLLVEMHCHFILRLDLGLVQKPSKTQPGALDMKIKVVKNMLAPGGQNATAEFEFVCAKGIEPYNDVISYAKNLGILRFAGSAVKLNLPEKDEDYNLHRW